MLPRHTCCALSHLCCNGHSLLLSSHLFRFGRIENLSCIACGHPSQDTSNLILHCPVTDSAPLALWRLYATSGPRPEELPGFWDSMVFRHAPIPQKDPGNCNNNRLSSFITWFIFLYNRSKSCYKFDNELRARSKRQTVSIKRCNITTKRAKV